MIRVIFKSKPTNYCIRFHKHLMGMECTYFVGNYVESVLTHRGIHIRIWKVDATKINFPNKLSSFLATTKLLTNILREAINDLIKSDRVLTSGRT